MERKTNGKQEIPSGVRGLDSLLGGLLVGDNVLWHDQAGGLAWEFCRQFVRESEESGNPIIFVTFDRSPRNLLQKLGILARHEHLIVLDCFTYGKGGGSDVFLKFYADSEESHPCSVVCVREPQDVAHFSEKLYSLHANLSGVVRLVFESITGMHELWSGEDRFIQFYSHSCPRLYELNTVAYWLLEKKAHTSRFLAQLNHIAQVAIDLSVKRGTTSLSVIKAEGRNAPAFHEPRVYWVRDQTISFEDEKGTSTRLELGARLKEVRTRRGLSQTELARLVGVTPSTISQVESNLIYPSVPALLKLAEVLAIDVGSLFQQGVQPTRRLVFPEMDAAEGGPASSSTESVSLRLAVPPDFKGRAEPHLIDIAPGSRISGHFFQTKGEELGYVLAGELQMVVDGTTHSLRTSDLVYLRTEIPSQWSNSGATPARLLWIIIR